MAFCMSFADQSNAVFHLLPVIKIIQKLMKFNIPATKPYIAMMMPKTKPYAKTIIAFRKYHRIRTNSSSREALASNWMFAV